MPARELAHMFDSLFRVSRRVEQNHFVIGFKSAGALTHPAAPARFPEAAVHEVEESTATKPARISPKRSSPNRFRSTAVKQPDREKRNERLKKREERRDTREKREERREAREARREKRSSWGVLAISWGDLWGSWGELGAF